MLSYTRSGSPIHTSIEPVNFCWHVDSLLLTLPAELTEEPTDSEDEADAVQGMEISFTA